MTVSGQLPDDVQTLLAWLACVAAAGTPADYVATLREVSSTDFTVLFFAFRYGIISSLPRAAQEGSLGFRRITALETPTY